MKGRKTTERNINVWLPLVPATGDVACNPAMCLDWEPNPLPFGLQTGTQSTEPHQPGRKFFFFKKRWPLSSVAQLAGARPEK